MRPEDPQITRRQALQWMAAAMPSLALPQPRTTQLTASQSTLLEEIIRAGCLFFWEQASPATGQVRDRAAALVGSELSQPAPADKRRVASTAATGFGLSALCIAEARGYLPGADIRKRILTTLRFHAHQLPHQHGFFFHFNDVETGERLWKCEVSSIDTAILLCGALTARAHFAADPSAESREIRQLATEIYERVDWPWMLNDPLLHESNDSTTAFSMGWKPESGFVRARWNHYCELMMIYLLAIGSPTHPVSPAHWNAFTRPEVEYAGFRYISGRDPIFTHQYTHAWFHLRNQRDAYADYFANSIVATRAHRAFCLSFKDLYRPDYWGITASDSAHGYTVWGGPPAFGEIDGTVVPCAAAGSLPFLPDACLEVLSSLRTQSSKLGWGRYGFVDALHPAANWYDADVLGIDQGITVLMAENLLSGFLWKTFMRNPEPGKAMALCGFRPSATANG